MKATPKNLLFGTATTQLNKPGNSFSVYPEKTIKKTTIINEATYSVKVTAKQTKAEHDAKLLNIKVEVTGPKQNSKSTVEGYVAYD